MVEIVIPMTWILLKTRKGASVNSPAQTFYTDDQLQMKRIYTLFLLLAVIITSVCCLSSCSSGEPQDTGTLTDMKISVLKIGKADAIVINTGTHVVLIDAGEEDDGVEIIEFLASEGIEKIDTMIITHFDPGNIGGADVVINNIKVDNIIEANYKKKSEQFKQYVQAMKDNGITPRQLNFAYTFIYDEAVFHITPPLKASYPLDKDNELSLVVSLTHGENEFFFAGDVLTDRMSELIKADIGEFDFIKIPNNGIYYPGTEEFAAYMLPKYAAITCSDKNPPSEKVVAAYQAVGCAVYETRLGNIHVFSDGSEIRIEQ